MNGTDITCFRLSGTVPTQIGLLTELGYLWLHENQLDGQYFPLQRLFRCEELSRNFSGTKPTIPTQTGLLTGLTKLILGSNQLDGQYFTAAAPFSMRGNFSESSLNHTQGARHLRVAI